MMGSTGAVGWCDKTHILRRPRWSGYCAFSATDDRQECPSCPAALQRRGLFRPAIEEQWRGRMESGVGRGQRYSSGEKGRCQPSRAGLDSSRRLHGGRAGPLGGCALYL